ncbi:unnamed protein product [Mytilus coruscus]|uniref:Uncharacterized protein n=1 Tax=Mytilus coruscus TaxID=42192 RepID=A0A6J8DVB7_MYTCO|nr:unnamed protein product [Mytilus coruscus]
MQELQRQHSPLYRIPGIREILRQQSDRVQQKNTPVFNEHMLDGAKEVTMSSEKSIDSGEIPSKGSPNGRTLTILLQSFSQCRDAGNRKLHSVIFLRVLNTFYYVKKYLPHFSVTEKMKSFISLPHDDSNDRDYRIDSEESECDSVEQVILTDVHWRYPLRLKMNRMLLESDTNFRNAHFDYARELLVYVDKTSTIVNGKIFASDNVHSLIHLADDVEHFGTSLKY